jgi:hypothetical protein
MLTWLSAVEVCDLARSSQDMAVLVAEILVTYDRVGWRVPWRVSYSVYLRARYATGPNVYDVVSRFRFISYLSRACRGCGKRTQRLVNEALLCSSCTRDPSMRCWMVPVSVAADLGLHYIFRHNGPRGALVFAEHLQILTGMTRLQLFDYARGH